MFTITCMLGLRLDPYVHDTCARTSHTLFAWESSIVRMLYKKTPSSYDKAV